MQIRYDTWRIKVHKGSGSLLVVLPARYCKRHGIKAGDKLTLKGDRNDGPPTLYTQKEFIIADAAKGASNHEQPTENT